MSFGQAVTVVLAVAVFVLAATMANLLARITVLERRVRELTPPEPALVRNWSDLPPRVQDLVDPADGGLLVFISPDCVACDDVVAGLARWPQDQRRRTRLVLWGQPRHDFVAPAGVRVVADASDVFTELEVDRTPWYLEIADGVVRRQGIGLPPSAELLAPSRGGRP
jgi:hypothetical protein